MRVYKYRDVVENPYPLIQSVLKVCAEKEWPYYKKKLEWNGVDDMTPHDIIEKVERIFPNDFKFVRGK